MGQNGVTNPKREVARWTLVTSVLGDDTVLRRTLLRSPAIDKRCQVIVKRGYCDVTKAYNAAMAEATNEIVVIAHHDVYLPASWPARLRRALDSLSLGDPRWGVLGVAGITSQGEFQGHVHSTGLKRTLGGPFETPVEAQSFDELLLIIRRSSELKFDERLPSIHFYGTDICLQARALKLKSYLIPAFCIHNSNGVKYLSRAFWQNYFYMRRKWWNDLPVVTCCATITRDALPIAKQLALTARDRLMARREVGTRTEDPQLLYHELLRSGAAREI
jgi:hypothetical protein